MDENKLQSAREAIAAGRFEEAAALLAPLHQRFPSHPEAAHALALCWAQAGPGGRALEMFEKAIALAPDDPAVRVNHGAALSRAGRADDAIAAFRRALELDPSLAGAHFNLAQELLKLDRTEEAARHLRTAVALFPKSPVFWRDLGRAEAKLGRWGEAVLAYQRGVADEACQVEARQELGVALENAGREDEALEWWRKLVGEAPLLPGPRNHLVALLAKRGDLEGAEREAQAAAAAAPGHADFHHNLGTVRTMRGDTEGATASFRCALLLDPARPETARAISAPPPDPRAEIEHLNPFTAPGHRVGALTFRIHSPDELSRALAHAIPGLLAALGQGPAEIRHVAPFHRGRPRRADVMFDYLDPAETRLADLTRGMKVERWVFGDVAPDLAVLRVRLWAAGESRDQSSDLPLDVRHAGDALRRAAGFARFALPATLPTDTDILHFGLGSIAGDDLLACDHLLAALRAAPFPAAESELLRRALSLLQAGDASATLAVLDRALALRPAARLWLVKGQALFSTREFEAARDAWDRARALDPALRPPALPAGWLEMKAGNLEAAEAFFREASGDEDEAAGADVGLGCVAMARQDLEGARKRFLEALAKSPRLPEALFQMALTYIAEGKEGEALRWAGKLEQANEGHPLVGALARVMGRA